MKKISILLLAVVFLITTAGCTGELRRKFVRKKKEEKASPVLSPIDYESEFTPNQRYANHYAFWKNAATEVIRMLENPNINYKKLKFHSDHALIEIKQLRRLLLTEQQSKLDIYINDLVPLVGQLKDRDYVKANKHIVLKKIKHHYRGVAKNFLYSKMQNQLKE